MPARKSGSFVYIGLHLDTNSGVGVFQSATLGTWSNSDTYSNGTTNPFGTAVNSADEAALVADYTLSGDTVAPTLQIAQVQTDQVTLAFDEALNPANIPAGSDFAITVNLIPRPVVLVSISGSSAQLELESPVQTLDIVKASYTTGALRDLSGNLVASFSNATVTNATNPIGARRVSPSSRVAVARRIDPTDRRAGVGGGL